MIKHSPSWFVLSSEATAEIGPEALIPTVILTFVAVVITGLRWYTRIALSPPRSIKSEDYLVTLALVLSIAYTAAVGGEYTLYGGKIKQIEKHLGSLTTMLKLVFAQSILYHLSLNLVKIALLFQYARVFAIYRPVVFCCYVLYGITLAAAAWGVLGVFFLCQPIHLYWDVTVKGKCMSAETHFFSTGIIGIVLDWAIWLLPLPVVGRLNLRRRHKVLVLGVFGLGGFVCVVSILRLVLVHNAAHANKVTKSGTYALIFSSAEVNVVIICASLLVLKPLLRRHFSSLGSVSAVPNESTEDREIRMRGLAPGLPPPVELMQALRELEEAQKEAEREEAQKQLYREGDVVRKDTAIDIEAQKQLYNEDTVLRRNTAIELEAQEQFYREDDVVERGLAYELEAQKQLYTDDDVMRRDTAIEIGRTRLSSIEEVVES